MTIGTEQIEVTGDKVDITRLSVGQDLVDGCTLAVEEWNAKGGVLGMQVELLSKDDEALDKNGIGQREKEEVLFFLYGLKAEVVGI